MKYIQLTQKKQAIVDNEDFAEMNQWKWCYSHGYAYRKSNGKTTYMHRLLADGKEIDHINGDKLDNRKENLRACTRSQNMANTGIRSTNTSGFKGVSFNKRLKKFRAYIILDNKEYSLGHFIDRKEAAMAYDSKARELFGEFANLNTGRIA